jgi:glycosyltransferase involved in cell wall biosynthesis
MIKLSATILIHNNNTTINKTIDSIKDLVNEIIVIDDYSTDNTVEIIESLTNKAIIYQRKLDNDFATQRNFSLEKCTNEWVIVIDSDEEITNGLKNNILKVLENPKYLAYNCQRLNQNIAGYSPAKLDRPILMKQNLPFKDTIHEVIDEELGFLDGDLLHHSWFGMDDFINDINKYTTWKAKKWIEEGRDYSILTLSIRQPLMFIYIFFSRYIGEKRFKHGSIGFLYSFTWASEELFVGLKFYELNKGDRNA